MGSYGVIKEALLVKQKGSTDEYTVVQNLVPATVNGVVTTDNNGGFKVEGNAVSLYSVYNGGAFGFSDDSKTGNIRVTVNIPGYGVKTFSGLSHIIDVNGVGRGVLCAPHDSDQNAPYTHLCLVVDAPGNVFV